MRLALVLLAGCWTGEPRRATPMPASRPVVREPFPMQSEWVGVYRCSQGETRVRLTLAAEREGVVRAVFEFGPTPENPHLASGAYKLAGTIAAGPQGTFDVALEPVEWVAAPDGYIMVPVKVRSSRRWTRLVGRMLHPSCGAIDVQRVNVRPP